MYKCGFKPLKQGAGKCGSSADKTPPLTPALTPASPLSSIDLSGEAVNFFGYCLFICL
jgi:hypothetical protein